MPRKCCRRILLGLAAGALYVVAAGWWLPRGFPG